MKTAYLVFLSLLVGSVFTDCSDEKEEAALPSKFVYNGKQYPLTKGYIELVCATPTIEGDFFAIDVYVLPSTVSFTGKCSGFDATGTGDFIGLSLLSKSQTELTVGVYSEPGSTNIGDIQLNSAIMYNMVNGNPLSKGMTGSVSVSRTADEYTIEFSLTVVPVYGGGEVTGKFVGTLSEF